MMIGSVAARWLFTAVFAAAAQWSGTGKWVGLPRGERPGPGRRAGRAADVYCMVMCAALIAMAWWPEPAAATWVQAALFGCAAIAFTALRRRGPTVAGLHHAVMAAAMIWMLTVVPAAARMRPPGHGAMAAMPGAGPPAAVQAAGVLIAVCCAAAAIPWLARAIGPGLRVRDAAAGGQAVMSAGMAGMLIAML